MAIPLYLAQTAAEFASSLQKPKNTAWMACHFSPYATDITNIPKYLPKGSLLILNDRTPPCNHDPETICRTLQNTVNKLECCGVLLDFQCSGCEEIVAQAAKLPFPVAVTERYAGDTDCGVFLASMPAHIALADYIAPWKKREIWLEVAIEYEQVTILEQGSSFSHFPENNLPYPFSDDMLHCRYRTEITDNKVCFHLHRGKEEINAMLAEAEKLGITLAVGLYQELGCI